MCVEGVGGAGGGGGGVVGGVGRGSPHKKKEHLVGKIAKASNTAENVRHNQHFDDNNASKIYGYTATGPMAVPSLWIQVNYVEQPAHPYHPLNFTYRLDRGT